MAEKDYDAIASQVVELVGGKGNIAKVTHCITRVRLVLKDKQVGTDHIADVEAIDGVLKVIEGGGQYQVCIDTDVAEVYDRVVALTGVGMGEAALEEVDADEPAEKKGVLSMITTAMGSIFMPLMGAMVGCGMVSAITTILMVTGLLSADSPTYTLLHDIGMSLTYFLPIVIGASAGKYFGLDMWIGAAIGCAMMYPTINNPELAGTTVNVFGVVPLNYQGYEQTVFPSILAVMLAARVYRLFDKICPKAIAGFMVPACTIAVMVPVVMVVIGPVTNWLSDGVAVIANTLIGISPILVGLVIGAAWGTVIIPLGMHGAIAMGLYSNLFTQGYDYTLGLLCVFTPNIGIMLAEMLRTKNAKKKEDLLGYTLTNVMGVGEPGLYGYVMQHKEAMAVSAIAAGLGCATAAAFGTAFYAIGTSGILSFPSYMNPDGSMNSLLGWIFGNLVALAAGFALTWFWNFDKDEDVAATAAAAA